MTSSAGNTDTSGQPDTSLSAPLAAGVAAAILSANPALTPAQLKSVIEQGATPGAVTNRLGVANRDLYSRITVPFVLSVSIRGPTVVLPGSSCACAASVSGSPGPYSYAWAVNGKPVVGDVNVILVSNSGSPYDVGAAVTAPGAAGGTNVAVSIASSAPP